MARNRKYRTGTVPFGPPVKAFLLCLLIGGSGIGYVWQKSQIDELGKQLGKHEYRLKEVNEQNTKLRKQLAEMRSPRYLNMRIKELNLGLGPVPLSQVCKLNEPVREPANPAAERDRQYAAQAASGQVLP
jgi:hypothetical protein